MSDVRPAPWERSPRRSVSDARGADEGTGSLVGNTVAWARAHFEEIYKTTLGGMAFVDGNRVPEDHILEEGQVLEFADEEDEEWAAEMHRSPDFWATIRQRRGEAAIPLDEAKRRLGVD